MDLSVNGQCKIPPGFRFHPTEEELLQYYLKKKVAQVIIELDVIPCVDLNKLEPWDIQETCKIGSGPQNEWYFFSRKDKKYPSGTRTNRATESGFWKATGRDKIVYNNSKRIGLRKTLVFYLGRAPAGKKSDWIMYEYRVEDNSTDDANNAYNFGEFKAEDWWVICRLFKKRNFIEKERPQYSSTSSNTSNGQPQFFSSQKVKHNLQENTAQNSNRSTIIGDENNEFKPSIRLISSNVDNDQDQRSEGCDYAVDNILRGFHYSNSIDPFINQENERIRDFDFSQCVHNLQMPIMPYLFPSTPYQESEVYSSNDDLWSLLDNLI